MRPITDTIPKAMIEVAGEPFIAHQLRLFKREQIGHVVLCLGYLGEMVAAFVGAGTRFGLNVSYSYDGERLMGTGGALRRALPLLDDPFFMTYGDSYLDIAYAPVAEGFADSSRAGLMTVFRNEGRWDKSNVIFEEGLIRTYSKTSRQPEMHFIDYGLGVLRASTLLSRSADERFDLATLYGDLAANGELAGFEAFHRFYEIGSIQGLAETDTYLKNRRVRSPDI